MTTISIVYSSGRGHTKAMAQAIHKGCRVNDDIHVNIFEIDDRDFSGSRWQNEEVLASLDGSDAIIFGSPTYMGGISSKMKAFMEASVSRYLPERWNGKIAAGFTVSGLSGGDKLNTLMSIATFAMQHGMIWVSLGCHCHSDQNNLNHLGYYFGAVAQAAYEDDPELFPNKNDLLLGQYMGRRVTEYAKKLI